jgi:hypothetical protein
VSARVRSRRLAIAAVRAAGALAVAFLALLAASGPAAACDVSYEYKPSFELGGDFGLGGDRCSTGESLTGVALVAILGVAVLAGVGVRTLRRGEAEAAALSGGAGAPQTLDTYLSATGIEPAR